MKIKEMLEDLFDLPRTFCAWIVFHLAKWLDLRVMPNDNAEDLFEDIFEEIEDIDIKEIDKE